MINKSKKKITYYAEVPKSKYRDACKTETNGLTKVLGYEYKYRRNKTFRRRRGSWDRWDHIGNPKDAIGWEHYAKGDGNYY